MELMVFKKDGVGEIRTVTIGNEPWFVARDVCEALGLNNVSMATSRLDEDEKGVTKIDTLGGMQEMTTINESGLYSLIMTSNKPEAKQFKRWVTHEVLPSIRKTGSYEVKKVSLSDTARNMAKQLELLTEEYRINEGNRKELRLGMVAIEKVMKSIKGMSEEMEVTTGDIKKKAELLYSRGMMVKDISKETGVSQTTLYDWKKKLDWKRI